MLHKRKLYYYICTERNMQVGLIYFCQKQGPVILNAIPSNLTQKDYDFVSKIFDIAPLNKFFLNTILEEHEKKVLSYSFELRNGGSRGGVEMFMICVMHTETIDLEFVCNHVRLFVDKMRDIEDLADFANDERCLDRKIMTTYLHDLYQKLIQRAERSKFTENIFSAATMEKIETQDIFLNTMLRTFISSIDARTPEGAILLYDIGKELASRFFGLFKATNIEDLVKELKGFWKKMKLGEMEEFRVENNILSFKMYECFECKHMPNIGKPVCKFDEGFLKHTFELKLRKPFLVKETECVATGKQYCKFMIIEAEKDIISSFTCD